MNSNRHTDGDDPASIYSFFRKLTLNTAVDSYNFVNWDRTLQSFSPSTLRNNVRKTTYFKHSATQTLPFLNISKFYRHVPKG